MGRCHWRSYAEISRSGQWVHPSGGGCGGSRRFVGFAGGRLGSAGQRNCFLDLWVQPGDDVCGLRHVSPGTSWTKSAERAAQDRPLRHLFVDCRDVYTDLFEFPHRVLALGFAGDHLVDRFSRGGYKNIRDQCPTLDHRGDLPGHGLVGDYGRERVAAHHARWSDLLVSGGWTALYHWGDDLYP